MSKTNTKTVESSKSAKAELTAEMKALVGMTCKVTKGRKFPIGSTIDIVKVGISAYNRPYAATVINGKMEFADPTNLSPVKEISAAKLATLEAEKEASQNEVILIPVSIRKESEKAVCIHYSGWYQTLWLPKTMVTVHGQHPDDADLQIIEVPGWKIRSAKPDSIESLLKQQDALAKLIEEPAKPEPKTELIKRSVIVKKGK